MERVTDDVFVRDGHSLTDTYRGCTHGMVRTSAGVVLVDAPMVPTDARAWRETVGQYGDATYLVSTHHHLDHTAGTHFFDAVGIAHAATKPRFDDQSTLFSGSDETSLREYVTQTVAGIDPDGLPLPDEYRVADPSVYVDPEATLAVGDHTVELVHTPGHTAGDLGVYVPEEGVYFAGDTVTNGVYPSLASCRPLEWLDSLARIQALDADVIVPGHGEAGDPAMVARFERFLRRFVEATADAGADGTSADAIVDALPHEEFPPPLHPGRDRGRADVAQILSHDVD